MGFAMCTQSCEPEDASHPISAAGVSLESLSFEPLPPKELDARGKALLGAKLPDRPRAAISDTLLQDEQPEDDLDSRRGIDCGRPGDPLNKVCLLLSHDFEGFLPYTLIISEEVGLEFSSLTTSAPDFVVDPGNIVKADRLSYDALRQDRSVGRLCRTIAMRPDLQGSATWSLEDRVHPPFIHTVHLLVRQGAQPAGLTMLVAVQTEPLADELVKSCLLLRKRRALRAHESTAPPVPQRGDLQGT
eukprot:CAMPEP_0197693580 /NCGR_PEP_ID=MMETSP1338-20131121/112703_1 /TAXON_ID=43686 ORGANISM="Pelagodinium beii, Strain RCC1491" /NCGR_SAMPLE_ID=MMETSP1338 /ASSEMBLY_ACC=CAM_ASM_000754 /LENGTH=244 /DNA_ID=CAMNT_0043276345 /DNA_START=31 /DNA_END=761 /DNA_ORIENTATION=+